MQKARIVPILHNLAISIIQRLYQIDLKFNILNDHFMEIFLEQNLEVVESPKQVEVSTNTLALLDGWIPYTKYACPNLKSVGDRGF